MHEMEMVRQKVYQLEQTQLELKQKSVTHNPRPLAVIASSWPFMARATSSLAIPMGWQG